MRWLFLSLALCACTKDKPAAPDAAASADPVSSAELSPDAAMATLSVNGKPFIVASVAAFLTNRLGEKVPIVMVTLQDPVKNVLTFDIPWKDGVAGDIADLRVTYASNKGVSYTPPQPAHINVTRVDKDDAGCLYDANFELSVKNAANDETFAVRGSFNRLRVKEPFKHLRKP